MTLSYFIGVDVGMSGTAVAFCNTLNPGEISTVPWPSGEQGKNGTKTPTRVSYTNTGELDAWGFAASPNSNSSSVKDFFKVKLGREGQEQDLIQRWYRDFLQSIYNYLSQYFRSFLGGSDWDTVGIQFLFSVPATWGQDVIEHFRVLIGQAGFGSCAQHRAAISLQEPQAVATFELLGVASPFKAGNKLLIADIGGGTGDFSLLKITSEGESKPLAEELAPMTGEHIGSYYIDSGCEELLRRRLEPIQEFLKDPVNISAGRMTRASTFQDLKCSFNGSSGWGLPVGDSGTRGPFPDTDCIEGGVLTLHTSEVGQLFDEQLAKVRAKIRYMADCLESNANDRAITPLDHIILSGGLGSSSYIQRGVRDFLKQTEHPMLKGAALVLSADPICSVCIGLVQHAAAHPTLFSRVLIPTSFGIGCRVPHYLFPSTCWQHFRSQAKKKRRMPVEDDFKQKWLENCVQWFIHKGQVGNDGKPVRKKFTASFAPDTPLSDRICLVKILGNLSDDPSPFEDDPATRVVARLRVDMGRLSPRQVVEKNKRSLAQKLGQKHHLKVSFVVEARIALTEAEFKCLDPTTDELLSKPVVVDSSSTSKQVEDLLPLSMDWVEVEAGRA